MSRMIEAVFCFHKKQAFICLWLDICKLYLEPK